MAPPRWASPTASDRSNLANKLISSFATCGASNNSSMNLARTMSSKSSNGADWSSMLTPPQLPDFPVPRTDDPRLDQVIARGPVDTTDLQPGRPVLLGFPVDEGVR